MLLIPVNISTHDTIIKIYYFSRVICRKTCCLGTNQVVQWINKKFSIYFLGSVNFNVSSGALAILVEKYEADLILSKLSDTCLK